MAISGHRRFQLPQICNLQMSWTLYFTSRGVSRDLLAPCKYTWGPQNGSKWPKNGPPDDPDEIRKDHFPLTLENSSPTLPLFHIFHLTKKSVMCAFQYSLSWVLFRFRRTRFHHNHKAPEFQSKVCQMKRQRNWHLYGSGGSAAAQFIGTYTLCGRSSSRRMLWSFSTFSIRISTDC